MTQWLEEEGGGVGEIKMEDERMKNGGEGEGKGEGKEREGVEIREKRL